MADAWGNTWPADGRVLDAKERAEAVHFVNEARLGRLGGVKTFIEMHDDLPVPNCTVLRVMSGNFCMRLIFTDWQPRVALDVVTMYTHADTAYQARDIHQKVVLGLRKPESAAEISGQSRRYCRDGLVAERRQIDTATLAIMAALQDVTNWLDPVPVDACADVFAWMEAGQ